MPDSLVAIAAPTIAIGIGIAPWLAIVLAILLVFLNGFFVAAEFALVKVRSTQIEPDVARGEKRARLTQKMIEHLDAYLSATQLGITLASLGLGWIGEPAFAQLLAPLLERIPGASPALGHTISLAFAFTVITVLHIIVGELAPKSLAIGNPKATSLWVATPLYLFYKITYPLIWALNTTANKMLRLVGIRTVVGGSAVHSEEEVRSLLASRQDSQLSDEKRELLENVFELSERTVRQIMIPRSDVVFLSDKQTMEENLQTARTSGHTRYPLCEGDLDHVVGIVHIKDLFRAGDTPATLTELSRQISFVPETVSADKLLRRLRNGHIHMAAVLDEFGGISGIVTLENVIEEIVGEIQDEFDTDEPVIERGPSGEAVVDARMPVDEFNAEFSADISPEGFDTLGGLLYARLGKIPEPGDVVNENGLRLQVITTTGRRIRRIRVVPEPRAVADPESEAGTGKDP